MKKLIIVAVLSIALSGFAQDGNNMKKSHCNAEMEKMSPTEKNQLHLKKMTENLNLNVKQQEEIGQLLSEKSAKKEEMKANRKKQMIEDKKAMDEKMKKILSPEQFEKWNSQKEKRKENFQKRRHEMKE